VRPQVLACGHAVVECRSWRVASVGDRPRGAFCGVGVSFDCLAIVNGQHDVRVCQRRAIWSSAWWHWWRLMMWVASTGDILLFRDQHAMGRRSIRVHPRFGTWLNVSRAAHSVKSLLPCTSGNEGQQDPRQSVSPTSPVVMLVPTAPRPRGLRQGNLIVRC
jgi:hypothetical protein